MFGDKMNVNTDDLDLNMEYFHNELLGSLTNAGSPFIAHKTSRFIPHPFLLRVTKPLLFLAFRF